MPNSSITIKDNFLYFTLINFDDRILRMYKEFYNLKENPFNVTSDPEFFFSSGIHSEAFSNLMYGIKQRKGIILVTGEIGTGKTTLCRTLLDNLDNSTKSAFILNPNFSDIQLLKMILKDLGIEKNCRSKFDIINTLNDFLLNETSEGNNVVVLIDEAQNLKPKQLEQIRLLSNLETEKQKLLQIVLCGQPELLETLALENLRQLNQRITVRYHILPLKKEDVSSYINHRVSVAAENNLTEKIIFTDAALDLIFSHSYGTPRMINIICDRALLAGYVEETFRIDENIIHKCIREIIRK